MIFVQFARGMESEEAVKRLMLSLSEHLDGPIHHVPLPIFMEPNDVAPRRAVMWTNVPRRLVDGTP